MMHLNINSLADLSLVWLLFSATVLVSFVISRWRDFWAAVMACFSKLVFRLSCAGLCVSTFGIALQGLRVYIGPQVSSYALLVAKASPMIPLWLILLCVPVLGLAVFWGRLLGWLSRVSGGTDGGCSGNASLGDLEATVASLGPHWIQLMQALCAGQARIIYGPQAEGPEMAVASVLVDGQDAVAGAIEELIAEVKTSTQKIIDLIKQRLPEPVKSGKVTFAAMDNQEGSTAISMEKYPAPASESDESSDSSSESEQGDDKATVAAVAVAKKVKKAKKAKKTKTPITPQQVEAIVEAQTWEEVQAISKDAAERAKEAKRLAALLTEEEKGCQTREQLEAIWDRQAIQRRLGAAAERQITDEERNLPRASLRRNWRRDDRQNWLERKRAEGLTIVPCEQCGRPSVLGDTRHRCFAVTTGPVQRRQGMPMRDLIMARTTGGGVLVQRQPAIDVDMLKKEMERGQQMVHEIDQRTTTIANASARQSAAPQDVPMAPGTATVAYIAPQQYPPVSNWQGYSMMGALGPNMAVPMQNSGHRPPFECQTSVFPAGAPS
jgi:hypothetical protein